MKKKLISIIVASILLMSTEQIISAEVAHKKLNTNKNIVTIELPSLENKYQPIKIDPNKPLGDVFPIKESVSQFEKRFHKEVMLPQYIPFIPTHSGGNFSETNKLIQVDYLNQKTDERLYMMILLRPEEQVKNGENAKIISLVDGTKAIYNHIKESDGEFMRFKKGDLIYYISISKNNKEEKIGDLLKVANSLK